MPTSDLPPEVAEWRRLFGQRLRNLRADAGLTQDRLAQLAGVDRKLIYRTELGQTSPRLDAVVQIAAALNLPVADLVRPPS